MRHEVAVVTGQHDITGTVRQRFERALDRHVHDLLLRGPRQRDRAEPEGDQGLHERVLARTPAARWGAPADFEGIAVFLSSAASDFITGIAIPVDGGYSTQV